jgi:hypothetical protein
VLDHRAPPLIGLLERIEDGAVVSYHGRCGPAVAVSLASSRSSELRWAKVVSPPPTAGHPEKFGDQVRELSVIRFRGVIALIRREEWMNTEQTIGGRAAQSGPAP